MTLSAQQNQSRRQVIELFWLGFVMMVVGLVLAFANWPHTNSILAPDGSGNLIAQDAGNALWAWIGVLAAGAGQLFALVALIAWGVRYGVESAYIAPAVEAEQA